MAPIDMIFHTGLRQLDCRSKATAGAAPLNRRSSVTPPSIWTTSNFQVQPQDESQSGLRSGYRRLVGRARRRTGSLGHWQRQSHLARPSTTPVIQQGIVCCIREAHALLESWRRHTRMANASNTWNCSPPVPLLIHRRLGMRKLPLTAAEELLEIIMRRYERASTLLTSNRPVERLGQAARR